MLNDAVISTNNEFKEEFIEAVAIKEQLTSIIGTEPATM